MSVTVSLEMPDNVLSQRLPKRHFKTKHLLDIVEKNTSSGLYLKSNICVTKTLRTIYIDLQNANQAGQYGWTAEKH